MQKDIKKVFIYIQVKKYGFKKPPMKKLPLSQKFYLYQPNKISVASRWHCDYAYKQESKTIFYRKLQTKLSLGILGSKQKKNWLLFETNIFCWLKLDRNVTILLV